MGRHQVYKGNPAQKRYYVTDNFSGGINTVATDEAINDYEFRNLVNVDISKQGIITNRKGFNELGVITKLLNLYNIELPEDNISLFKVIENNNNILEKISNGNSNIRTYKNGVINSDYWFNYDETERLTVATGEYVTSVFDNDTEPGTPVRLSVNTGIPYWLNSVTYANGYIVYYLGHSYVNISGADSTGDIPSTSSLIWELVDVNVDPDTIENFNEVSNDYEFGDKVYSYNVSSSTDGKYYMYISKTAGQVVSLSDTSVWRQIAVDYFYVILNKYEGNFKFLIISENHINLLEYDGVELEYTTIMNNSKELPSVSSYKTSLTGINVVEYVNNLYMSLNDISEYYKGILIYDRDTDTWITWRGEYDNSGTWTDFDSDLLTDVYKPTPYDISSNSNNITQGFNVLAKSPLLYIDRQNIALRTIRNIILTSSYVDGHTYIDKIPTSGDFIINVIKTGDINFKPEQLRIIIRDQEDNILNFEIGSTVTNEYGIDNGGYIEYPISNLDTTGVSYVLIDIIYQNKVINKAGISEATLETGDFNTLNNYYAVNDENFIYKMITSDGRLLSHYEKVEVNFSAVVTDVSSAVVSDVFSLYDITDNDGTIFQLKDDKNHRIFSYANTIGTGSGTWTEITATDNILYDTWEDFIPLNGTLITTNDTDNYYRLHYNVSTSKTLNTVLKSAIDLNQVVNNLEGQYFEISDDEVSEPIEGLDLEEIKLITINDKLVYYKGNSIYFSSLYQFDYVPNFAFVLLPLLSTDEIVTIKYFKGAWIIFTKYSIWKMKGTYGDSNWELQQLNTVIGCIAPDTVRSIDNTLYFVSENGLYKLTQNYYLEGLENVYKADKNIPDVIPYDNNIKSILYRNQYILYLPKDEYDYDTIKMYHDIDLPNKLHPFIKDKFRIYPDILTFESGNIISLTNGLLWIYDNGYTDFMPVVDNVVDENNYTYKWEIESSGLNFGFPTHDKKFKSMYIKTISSTPMYLLFTIWIDDYLKIEPYSYRVTLNENEEVVYEQYEDYDKDNNINLTLAELSNFELGEDLLGDNENSTHKIVLSEKGKTIKFKIEGKSNGEFGITNIGYLYKLGKVREQR